MMGGSAIAALRYALYLNELPNYSVKLLGPVNPAWSEDLKRQFPFIETINVPFFDKIKPSNRLDLIRAYIAYWVIFFRTLLKMFSLRNKYDQVHLFDCWLDFNFCAIRVGKLLGKKVIVESCLMGADDPETIINKGNKTRYSIDWMRMKDYLMADLYISKSSYMDEYFKKHFNRDRYVTIPYFVDTSRFYPATEADKDKLKRHYEIPEDRKVILFVGAMIPRKGAKELVKAFLKFQQENPRYYLIMVSPMSTQLSDYQKEILKELALLGGESHRVYKEVIDFVPDLMRLCDIYCLPSIQEGLPISICEAMCCGKFVIASDIGEIRSQQIQHLESGYLSEPSKPESIIQGFTFFSMNNAQANLICSKAISFGIRNFSLDVISSKYKALYQKVE